MLEELEDIFAKQLDVAQLDAALGGGMPRSWTTTASTTCVIRTRVYANATTVCVAVYKRLQHNDVFN